LNSWIFEIPPLRERPEDILPLVSFFAGRVRPDLKFHSAAISALTRYSWPGNVRELENAVNIAAETCNRFVSLSDLPLKVSGTVEDFSLEHGGSIRDSVGPNIGTKEMHLPLRDAMTSHIHTVLASTNGNKTHAARVLGVHLRTLQRMLDRIESGNDVEALVEIPTESPD
jgi:DNA-binding NtrC family response regulator